MPRTAIVTRTTRETDCTVGWDLDGAAEPQVSTGIGFLDHMLTALGTHSRTALRVATTGDLHIDGHHTVEDTGIVMGQALRQALGDRKGLERFGHALVPLDEALVECAIDLSGRPSLTLALPIPAARLGDLDTELVREFFAALTDHGRFCLHLHLRCGVNSHHIVEAAFKATARALRAAIATTNGTAVPSTKGSLD